MRVVQRFGNDEVTSWPQTPGVSPQQTRHERVSSNCGLESRVTALPDQQVSALLWGLSPLFDSLALGTV